MRLRESQRSVAQMRQYEVTADQFAHAGIATSTSTLNQQEHTPSQQVRVSSTQVDTSSALFLAFFNNEWLAERTHGFARDAHLTTNKEAITPGRQQRQAHQSAPCACASPTSRQSAAMACSHICANCGCDCPRSKIESINHCTCPRTSGCLVERESQPRLRLCCL